MRPTLFSMFLAGAISASSLLGQDSPPAAASPAATAPAATPPAVTSAPAAPASLPAAAAVPAAAPVAAPAPVAAVAPPAAAPAPAPAAVVAAPVVAPAPAARVIDPVTELTARVAVMEQLLVTQRDREIAIYRDANRLITIFALAFAGVGAAALVAAGYLVFRSFALTQRREFARPTLEPRAATSTSLVPAGEASVPGMERVQASGTRFQSRMSSLEDRLSELEHLAGREPAPIEAAPMIASISVPSAPAENGALARAGFELEPPEAAAPPPPPRRVVPRAAILVHKAQALMNLGKLAEALATLDEAQGLEPANAEVHLARGQALEKLGRLGDALEAYEHACVADAGSTAPLLLKAGVLNRQDRFAEALACYDRALEVHRAGA